MSPKTFYRYNPLTEQYDRVYPSRRERVWASLRQYVTGVAAGVAIAVVFYCIYEFPRERLLRRANARLEQQLEMLGRRSDEAFLVMEELAARDNNLYRVLMQAEPLSSAERFAGLERQRYYDQLTEIDDPALVKNVTDRLDRLDNMLYNQIKSYDFLRERSGQMAERISHVPSIQPISTKDMKTMASGYGYRRDPIYGTTRFHSGMDFSSNVGTAVYATGDGRVTAGEWRSGYGNVIDIDHGYNYTTRYAHLSEILVKPGQTVKRGDLIGRVGNSGKSTGPHLHYEVRLKGEPQNPVNYYFMDLTPEEYDEMIRRAENAGHMMD